MLKVLFFLSTVLCLKICEAQQAPKLLGRQGEWRAYIHGHKEHQRCFLVSQPQKQEGSFTKRGTPHIMVASSPRSSSWTVSIIAGYPYKKQSTAKVMVSGQSFELFTKEDTAWAFNDQEDAKLVGAFKTGKVTEVESTSVKDNIIHDTYSLEGFKAALKLAHQACALKKVNN